MSYGNARRIALCLGYKCQLVSVEPDCHWRFYNMTIKPVLSQKTAKHENKDIQDVQGASLTGASARPSHRLNQKARAKSPSPQREAKTSSSRSHIYDVTSVGGGGGSVGGGIGSVSVGGVVVGVSGASNTLGLGLGSGNVLRRRRSPHKRNSKRDAARCVEQRDKSCKSPPYQVDCSAITPCSSPHSSSGKSPKSTSHGAAGATSCLAANVLEDSTSYSGYNSGDEHIGQKDTALPPDEWDNRDKMFIKMMSDRGFVVNEIAEDGACLFRSISLQVFLLIYAQFTKSWDIRIGRFVENVTFRMGHILKPPYIRRNVRKLLQEFRKEQNL